jgi:hypothetical protein
MLIDPQGLFVLGWEVPSLLKPLGKDESSQENAGAVATSGSGS